MMAAVERFSTAVVFYAAQDFWKSLDEVRGLTPFRKPGPQRQVFVAGVERTRKDGAPSMIGGSRLGHLAKTYFFSSSGACRRMSREDAPT
jgi:hypothetical protein